MSRKSFKPSLAIVRQIEAVYGTQNALGEDWMVKRAYDMYRSDLTPLSLRVELLKILMRYHFPALSKSEVAMEVSDAQQGPQRIDLVSILMEAKKNPNVKREILEVLNGPIQKEITDGETEH
jgi:hypothetical protein